MWVRVRHKLGTDLRGSVGCDDGAERGGDNRPHEQEREEHRLWGYIPKEALQCTIQSLTVGGSLYDSNAPTLIPLARAATHFGRNLRKFVSFFGKISQPSLPRRAAGMFQ